MRHGQAYQSRRGTADAVFREHCRQHGITDRVALEPEINWGLARVYFVHDHQAHLIKIGYTTNWDKRRHHIRTQAKQHGTLLGFLNGGRDLERIMHHNFAKYRDHGEWFSDEILPVVEHLIRKDREFFGIEPRERRVF